MEHAANKEQVFTVRAFAGDLPVECFLSARGFLEDHSLVRPAFSEDHVHASFELLLCRKGSGYQFIEGVAHAYADESVFLLAPFVTHAHIGNPDSAEVRCSIRFILPEAAAFSGRCEPALAAAGQCVAADQALPLYVRDKVAQTTEERAQIKALAQAALAAPVAPVVPADT